MWMRSLSLQVAKPAKIKTELFLLGGFLLRYFFLSRSLLRGCFLSNFLLCYFLSCFLFCDFFCHDVFTSFRGFSKFTCTGLTFHCKYYTHLSSICTGCLHKNFVLRPARGRVTLYKRWTWIAVITS